MIRVRNGKTLRRISRKILKASGGRNIIAMTAIAMTAMLFTAMLTMGGSVLETVQQDTFRQVGGDFHGGFKRLTEDQTEELRMDGRIRESGARLGVGVLSGAPFDKQYTEVSYMEENYAEHSFCTVAEGRPPASGKEIACDSRVLELLGIAPRVGAEVPLTISLGHGTARQQDVTDTFTLTGWWAFDTAGTAANVRVSEEYAESVLSGHGFQGNSDFSGSWSLNVFLSSGAHIQEELQQLLADHGYQSESMGEEGYVNLGVNWGYLNSPMEGRDATELAALGFLLLVVLLGGYLVIYNIFQISVSNDIRFYGLLKTIGTTPGQIRGIVRGQAFTLSLGGIPAGLALGWLLGAWISPMLQNLGYGRISEISADGRIFVFATLFTLFTVFLSCSKPGRLAGKVSPVEAVRYTDGARGLRKKKRHVKGGGTPFGMAAANLGRNRKKTLLTVLSLALAAVLFQTVFALGGGFDMDKFLRRFVVSDFVVGDAGYLSRGYADGSLTQRDVEAIVSTGYVAEGGITWQELRVSAAVPESYYRYHWSGIYEEETLGKRMERLRQPDGGYSQPIQLYGLEAFPMEQLTVLEGSLEALADPSGHAVAAVCQTDDYGQPIPGSHYAALGDSVTVRYEEDWCTRAWEDGRELTAEEVEVMNPDGYYLSAERYRTVTYTVAALVTMPEPMTSRYYSGAGFVLAADVLKRDGNAPFCLNYLCDGKEGKGEALADFLAQYTGRTAPDLDYEGKEDYYQAFSGIRNTVLVMGGVLSGLLAMVGALNFLNGELTSILARRKELAVLQAVGMTGGQLKRMLGAEGMLHALLAGTLSLVLGLAAGGVLDIALGRTLWFFTFRLNLWPVLGLALAYLALGAAIPLAVYHFAAKETAVERLRQE